MQHGIDFRHASDQMAKCLRATLLSVPRRVATKRDVLRARKTHNLDCQRPTGINVKSEFRCRSTECLSFASINARYQYYGVIYFHFPPQRQTQRTEFCYEVIGQQTDPLWPNRTPLVWQHTLCRTSPIWRTRENLPRKSRYINKNKRKKGALSNKSWKRCPC